MGGVAHGAQMYICWNQESPWMRGVSGQSLLLWRTCAWAVQMLQQPTRSSIEMADLVRAAGCATTPDACIANGQKGRSIVRSELCKAASTLAPCGKISAIAQDAASLHD